MNKRLRAQLLMRLKLIEGTDFWITRMTNIRNRLSDKATFDFVYFGTYDVAVLYSTDFGFGKSTMMELAFAKPRYTKNDVLTWFTQFDLRHYDINESKDNTVPPLADMVNISETQVLALAHKRRLWADETLRPLSTYLEDNSFFLPEGITPSEKTITQEGISSILTTLGLSL